MSAAKKTGIPARPVGQGEDLRRIRLIVAYDGTNYCGWQKQPNGVTIEEMLNGALKDLTGEDIEVIGASRTDAGVHAYGNVAVFDTKARMAADRFAYALNVRLPEDIRVQYSDEVPADWHPRKQVSTKTYEYRILNRRMPIPTERLYSYFTYHELDVGKMQEATGYFIGTHDFTSFCSVKTQAKTAVRSIYSLQVWEDGDMITIRISGGGFLYNMVRIISGTLLKIGMGVWEPDIVPQILAARDRQLAGETLPACGLTLLGIEYDDEAEYTEEEEDL